MYIIHNSLRMVILDPAYGVQIIVLRQIGVQMPAYGRLKMSVLFERRPLG